MHSFSHTTLLCVVVVAFSYATAVYCPGHKIRCQKDQTCCSDNLGSYGCCPYQNATCCTDGLHCCPEGTECDLAHGTCTQKKESVQLEKLISSGDIGSNDLAEDTNELNAGIFFLKKGGTQTCPDGRRTCSSAYTCCAEESGSYACCPFENGVCCADHIHCCPHFNKCNLESRRCEKA